MIIGRSTDWNYYLYMHVLFIETGSEEFNQFISLLGNRVRLKGWDKYRGGLDVKGNLPRRAFFKLEPT